MKRTFAVSVAAVLVVGGAVAGTADAKARRVKVERHDSHGYVGAAGSSGSEPTIYVDEATFETERYERDVSIAITDRTGQAVSAVVRQDADGDGTPELEETICGATAEPLPIQGGKPVVVKVQPGPCADGTPAVMTSGSIGATFSGYVKAPSAPVASCPPSPGAREVTHEYVLAAGAGANGESWFFGYFGISNDETVGAALFQAGCGEGRVELTVADQAGLPAHAVIGADPDGPMGDAPERFVAEVCGSTDGPVDVTPGSHVTAYVLEGPCSDASPALATTGTATATFTAPAK